MPGRKLATHTFAIEAAASKPTAVISPREQSKVIGALIHLDGRASVSPEGDELTYAWEILETPLGSTVDSFTESDEDGSTITFVPDITGEYTLGLSVSTPYRTSDQATATVEIQQILTPYLLRTTPDGSQMFKALSSFWRMVEERRVFSTIWSGYMQIAAADLLRLFQVDFAKSIKTVQPLFQRRWLKYAPGLELDPALHTGIFGYHQSGDSAFTASGSTAAIGVIVSTQELILLEGTPTSDAVGEEIEVYTSAGDPGNIGNYTVNRLNSAGTGYTVSASTPFPASAEEVLSSGVDLVTFSSDTEVYVADTGVDFTALGVVAGDVLRILSGKDSGLHRISAVGTADGLDNDRTLELTTALKVSKSGRTYTIFKALRIFAQRTSAASTNTVYLPEDEADLAAFETSDLKGEGSIENVFEVAVEERHVFEALIGSQITITSGSDGGKTVTISGLNESGTGYLISTAFSSETFPEEVTYTIPVVTDVSSRVLVLEDQAYEIVSAVLDETGVSVDEGGFGNVWIVTLSKATAPAGQEGLSWRIAATIESDEYEDFEGQGLTQGDLLILEVEREDSGRIAEVPCTVLGAVGNKIAFDIGTQEFSAGADGALSGAEKMATAQELNIPRIYEDPEDPDEILVSLTAAEIQGYLASREFKSAYYNLPLSASTPLDIEPYTFRLRTARVIRNRRILVDETVSSIPALFEYIDEPEYGEDEELGDFYLAGKDGSVTALDREPLELLENRDYSVSSEDSLNGTNLETTAGSGLLKIPSGDLYDRDVRVGDSIDITSGFDQGRYVIQVIHDSETIKAATSLGDIPSTTATGLSFTLQKKTEGTFLRFVEGMFSPDAPAPTHLWAQTSLFDNSGYVEDNFGVLVGATRAQLDEYGPSQVSYKGAVTALMYAWANGPTLRNITTGCQVLVGLPVTEVAGKIIQIDPDYDTSDGTGRILVEDIDAAGDGTGLVRIYYYPATADSDTLSDFAGIFTNPATNQPFDIKDTVGPFQTLSKSVVVSDYITKPKWWSLGSRHELQKFHSWQVELDAHQVDSRDMPLIFDFCMGIRPIYTFPLIVLVLYLYDEVTVEDQLQLDPTLFLADEPAFSLESTHMLDSYNGSSLAQRILDHGSLSTRTFFEGRDLVTSAASGTVTSARGGFAATLDADPLDHALDEDVGVLSGINEWFEDDVYIRGTPLVAVGDVLFIREGVNRGRFEVTAVTDDNTLEITHLTGWPPRTRLTAAMEAETAQVFQIQRRDSSDIASGTATVESYDSDGDMTMIEDTSASFRWDTVSVGDVLVVEDGDDYGLHTILQVGKLDDTYDPDGLETPQEHLESLESHLIIAGELTESGPFAYSIRRDSIRSNPLLDRADGNTTAGSDVLTVDDDGLLLAGLQYGDLLIHDAPVNADNGIYKIVDVLTDGTLLLDREFTDSHPGAGGPDPVEYRVVRPALFEADEQRDHDWEQESLTAQDDVEIKLIEPITSFLSVADLGLSGADAVSAATDLQAAGVVAGMLLEIDVAAESSGAYEVLSVATDTATVEFNFTADEDPVSGEFFSLDDAWEVLDDTVTLSGTLNLEFGPMMATEFPDAVNSSTFLTVSPQTFTGTAGTAFETDFQVGDVVRLEGDSDLDWAIIAEIVSDTEITLDRNYTGTSPGAGRVERGTPGGLVLPGDYFTCDEGVFVVKTVQAATMTLTSDTGVSPLADYTGKVTRKLR